MRPIQILFLFAAFALVFGAKVKHLAADAKVQADGTAIDLQIYNLFGTQYRTETLTKFTKTANGWQSLRTTKPLKRGTVTEVTLKIWNGNNFYIGFSVNPDALYGEYTGQSENSWGYYCYDGGKYYRGTTIPYAAKCGTGDSLKIRINLTEGSGTVEYFLNGNNLGYAWGGLLGLNKDIYLAFGAYYASEVFEILSYSSVTPA